MPETKQVIGGPLVIGGRELSLSRAIRARDTVYLTGQIPMQNGVPMTTGSIQDQTRAVLDDITATLAQASCTRDERGQGHGLAARPRRFPGLQRRLCRIFPRKPARSLCRGQRPSGRCPGRG